MEGGASVRADRAYTRCTATYLWHYLLWHYLLCAGAPAATPHHPYYGRYADFYERAILNGIVGNQDRRDPTKGTSYIYMLPLGGAVKKAWGKSDFGFPCCWGTLSES